MADPVEPITPNNWFDEIRRTHPWWFAATWTAVFGGVMVAAVTVSDGERPMIALVGIFAVLIFVYSGVTYSWTADRPERRFRDRLRAVRAERPLLMATMHVAPLAVVSGGRPLIQGERGEAAVVLGLVLGVGGPILAVVNVELRNYARSHGLHPFGDGLHGDSAWTHQSPHPSDDPRRPRW